MSERKAECRELEAIIGETVVGIDFFNGLRYSSLPKEVLITMKSGKQLRLYHDQDCCETVELVSINGDICKLIGKPILSTELGVDEDYDGPEISDDSGTETKITLRCDAETVIMRWIGESNGYYGEDVDFEILQKEVTT
jgi:hypothetical protein